MMTFDDMRGAGEIEMDHGEYTRRATPAEVVEAFTALYGIVVS